jgi:hypothetical protein
VEKKMGRISVTVAVLSPILLVLLSCGEALALQTHGGSEGIVVHQLAHVQYLGALGYLIWDIRRSGFSGLGWSYLQRFCWLMICWNVLAFFGHLAQMALPEDAIAKHAGYLSSELLAPITFGRWAYYLTALDHLIITPALFFLFLAMRFFYRSQNAVNKGTH